MEHDPLGTGASRSANANESKERISDRAQDLFRWHTFDLRPFLPLDWIQLTIDVVDRHAVKRTLSPMSVTSRESDLGARLKTQTVDGIVLKKTLPWLDHLYRTDFLTIVQTLFSEPVSAWRGSTSGYQPNHSS